MNIDKTIQDLMVSETFKKLYLFAQTLPVDTSDPNAIKGAFSTAGIDLIRALDNDRIHFDNDHDKAMLFGLLTVTTDFVLDGNLSKAFAEATIN